MAASLQNFGHSIVFGVLDNNASLIKNLSGFEVLVYHDKEDLEVDFQAKWAKFMRSQVSAFKMEPTEQTKYFIRDALAEFYRFVREVDDQLAEIIKKVKPDFLIVDFYIEIPAVIKSGIPWAVLLSANPLRLYADQGAPPSGFGLNMDFDPVKGQELGRLRLEAAKDFFSGQQQWLISKGVTPNPKGLFWSPLINIYLYPESLDYKEFGESPTKWFRMDHLIRPAVEEPMGFDEAFFNSEEKKVFFTLGSMGGSDVDLMVKLVGWLAESRHKFVVSKGPFAEEIKLSDNMVGEKYVNQLKIIEKVDLVICHGGNNSLIESLYFAKPVIIMPLFGDQHDNGRRVEDKKIGKCLYPHKVEKAELLNAIDELLADDELKKRVVKISCEMRNSNCFSRLNQRLEDIIRDHKTS